MSEQGENYFFYLLGYCCKLEVTINNIKGNIKRCNCPSPTALHVPFNLCLSCSYAFRLSGYISLWKIEYEFTIKSRHEGTPAV